MVFFGTDASRRALGDQGHLVSKEHLIKEHFMALKDLIVHLDQGESALERLRLAADLAHRHGCRLTAIYVRERNEAQTDLQRTAELARASCKDFDRIRKHERLCIDNGATRLQSELDALQRELGMEVHWRSIEGIASKVVPQHARFADLCVVPHRAHSTDNLSEKLLFLTGRPVVFVPPDVRAEGLGSNVVVAWNSSRAAARSLADALPILERAKRVTVVAINPTSFVNKYGCLPPERIIEHLRRHNASVEGIWLNDIPTPATGDTLQTEARKLGADLLVAGAFGHPKLWEDVMGGVTRDLLSRMKVPTLMSY
jgi:nucleotide-binding universal stress UspA family protein